MTYLFILFSSFIITSFSMPFLIKFLTKNGITDKPELRKVHHETTPRMGGVIILPIIMIFLTTYGGNFESFKYFVASGSILLICGLIDDIIDLGWKYKIILQSIASIFLIFQINSSFENISLFGIELHNGLYFPLLFIFILGSLNSINLMDGLDGLVSGYTLLLLLPIILLAINFQNLQISIISISLIGIMLGLLKYNSYPAKVFLGDTGSLSIGITILFCLLSLSIPQNGQKKMDLTIPIMFLGIPITDTLKVIFTRLKNRNNIFLAAKDHLHHIILGNKIRHKTTVFLIHALASFFVLNTLLYIKYDSKYFFITFFVLLIPIILADTIAHFLKYFEKLIYSFKKFSIIPSNYITKHLQKLLSISLILFLLLYLLRMPITISLEPNTKYFLLLGWILLFIVALVNNNKSGQISHIYSLFNLILLFNIQTHHEFIQSQVVYSIFNFHFSLFNIVFILFLLIVILFFYARDKIIPKEILFFSGLDLTIFVLIISSIFIREVLPINIYKITASIFTALICYYWLKVYNFYYPFITKCFYYLFFIVNFGLIFSSILVK